MRVCEKRSDKSKRYLRVMKTPFAAEVVPWVGACVLAEAGVGDEGQLETTRQREGV